MENTSSVGYKTFASQFLTSNLKPTKQQVVHTVKNNKVKLLHSLTLNEKQTLSESFEQNEQTLLHYGAYFNSPTCTLYLLFNDLEIEAKDKDGKTPYQLCGYTGHIQVLKVMHEHWKMTKIKKINEDFVKTLTQAGFKRTDAKSGCLKSEVSQESLTKFHKAQQKITALYCKYRQSYSTFVLTNLQHQQSHSNRNYLHFTALNRYQKCLTILEFTAKSLQEEDLKINEDLLMHLSDIQHLISPNNLVDPRQYEDSLQLICQFILPQKLKEINSQQQKYIQEKMSLALQAKDKDGHTPLYLAAKTGSASIIALLRKLEKQYINDKKILNQGEEEIIKIALNNASRSQMTDLCEASKRADVGIMNFLISCGEQINKKKTIFGTFALLEAVKAFSKDKNIEPVQILLKSGADVNEQDTNGWTIFHHVAQQGHIEILKEIFLQRDEKKIPKLKINRVTNKGLHPLHLAALHNQLSVLETLLDQENMKKYEIIQNPLDEEKATILHYAAKKGCLESLKNILKSKGKELAYCQDVNDNTCLHLAASNNHYECVREIIFFDSDKDQLIKVRNKKGKLAKDLLLNKRCFESIFTAAREGNVNLIRNLLNEKKQLIDSATPTKKRTPLILSVMEVKLVNVKFLVESGADQYHQDQDGKTASQHAAELETEFSKKDKMRLPLIRQIKSLLD